MSNGDCPPGTPRHADLLGMVERARRDRVGIKGSFPTGFGGVQHVPHPVRARGPNASAPMTFGSAADTPTTGTVYHHVTVAGSTSGGAVNWTSIAPAPRDRVGFAGVTPPTTSIPVSLTGEARFVVSGVPAGSTVTVTLRRGGVVVGDPVAYPVDDF